MRVRQLVLLKIVLFLGVVIGSAQNGEKPSTSDLLASSSGKLDDVIVQRADVPLYPAIAKTARLSGIVRIHVVVKNGAIAKTQVDSKANSVLVAAAQQNLKTWQFAQSAEGSFEVAYVYELRKEQSSSPENPHIEMDLPHLVKIVARSSKPSCNDCSPDAR
jgi:hypothetical protein